MWCQWHQYKVNQHSASTMLSFVGTPCNCMIEPEFHNTKLKSAVFSLNTKRTAPD
jgi:hypothetical protein